MERILKDLTVTLIMIWDITDGECHLYFEQKNHDFKIEKNTKKTKNENTTVAWREITDIY